MDRRVALRTERLTLRPLVPADAGWITAEIARPEVQRMLPTLPHPYRMQDAEAWLAGRSPWPGNYAITRGGAPLGVVTLMLEHGMPELGYWLAKRAWGRGIATEAARAALARHFAVSRRPVPSGHILDNLASRRVLLKLGFTDVGLIFRFSHFRDHTVVVRRMLLTPPAWEVRRDA